MVGNNATLRRCPDDPSLIRKSSSTDSAVWLSQLNGLIAEHVVSQALPADSRIRRSLSLSIDRQRFGKASAELVLPYIDGIHLREHCTEVGILRSLSVLWLTAGALSIIHDSGFVHADIKPQNVLVTQTGVPVIIDFGQSEAVNVRRTRVRGTPGFMAPEQLSAGRITPATDVWGFGRTLFDLPLGSVEILELADDCCTRHPCKRPSFDVIRKRLSEIVKLNCE